MHVDAQKEFRPAAEMLTRRSVTALREKGRTISAGKPARSPAKSIAATLDEVAPMLSGPIMRKLRAALEAGHILAPGSLINIRV